MNYPVITRDSISKANATELKEDPIKMIEEKSREVDEITTDYMTFQKICNRYKIGNTKNRRPNHREQGDNRERKHLSEEVLPG